MFVGLAGVGSVASDVTLAAGVGMTVTLSPIKASGPFRLELVCFPQRKGLQGVADTANDKFQTWKNSSTHESHLGASFYLVTPIIYSLAERD